MTTMSPHGAIVTGAGTGIGRAIALRLAREGKPVVLLDIDPEAARACAAAIGRENGKAIAFGCDVSAEVQVQEAIRQGLAQLPDIDTLVNAVGVTSPPGMPFTANTEADWDRVFAINVKSAFFTSKAIAPTLTRRGDGRIINIGSIAGLIAARPMPPYSVSKMAMITLTRVLARDLAEHGVTVNAVCPGYVWTDLWSDDMGRQLAATGSSKTPTTTREIFDGRVRELVPMGRPQTPEDIAAAVAFLASREACNITGQSLNVDGGVTI